jgi:hypothetical protein
VDRHHGLTASLVLVRHPWHTTGLDTEATVRALTSALRVARSRAIVQDRDVEVVTNTSGFSGDVGSPWVLPDGTATNSRFVLRNYI